jgi:sulfatase maturation enzyme AslB (radical SAM superfamily)
MDLLVTIRTLTLRDVKVLHVEPTDVCQAACALCARETDTNFKKDRQHHLSMNQLLKVFDQEKVKQLDKMFMCGNYGDPAAGKHTLDMYKQFRQINPTIVLGMNTNGALQNTVWWYELAKTMNQPQDYVVFSIDGLEHTNATYRKNVVWDKLIANARSFIEAGGSAHWDMLVYRHNQHEVDDCEQFAQAMGFKWFRAKVSKRPFTENLQFPIGWQPIKKQSTSVSCHALAEKSVYIDSQGNLGPCCWLGTRQVNFITDVNNIPTQDPTCSVVCGQSTVGTAFDQQWQRNIELIQKSQ